MFPKLLEDLSKHNKLDLETILSCGLPCRFDQSPCRQSRIDSHSLGSDKRIATRSR